MSHPKLPRAHGYISCSSFAGARLAMTCARREQLKKIFNSPREKPVRNIRIDYSILIEKIPGKTLPAQNLLNAML